MTPELTKSQAALEQLADLNQTLEKEKVQLTPEVENYVREHIRAVQDKLQVGQDVYEKDLEFIPNVNLWVLMPKEWREKHPSIEDILKDKEIIDIWPEISKRHISVTQWQDLLHMAEASGNEKEWIDKTFQFPGGGKIKVEKDLELGGSTELKKLPEGLKVGGDLSLWGCTGLTELPKGLDVGCNFDLVRCTSLTSLPDQLEVKGYLELSDCTSLTHLPEGLVVGGELHLIDCKSLVSLPKRLIVGWNIRLNGCTSLISLPEDLYAGWHLFLSRDANYQVIEDAKRLKSEGKILGKVEYR
jgi:hypothetical protein